MDSSRFELTTMRKQGSKASQENQGKAPAHASSKFRTKDPSLDAPKLSSQSELSAIHGHMQHILTRPGKEWSAHDTVLGSTRRAQIGTKTLALSSQSELSSPLMHPNQQDTLCKAQSSAHKVS